jgi:NADH-quinone oxidoreductase subunit N
MDATNFPLGPSLLVVLPEIGLAALATIILFLDISWPESRRRSIAIVAGVGMAILSVVPLILSPDVIRQVARDVNPGMAEEALATMSFWGGMIRYDVLTQIFKVMILAAGALTALISVDVTGIGRKGEYYLIMIVSALGMTLMAGSSDLIMAFLALETTSIPLYILAGFRRGDHKSMESGMKYFLYGSFASAIMLYGMSLLYGFTGQTNIYAIAEGLAAAFTTNPLPILAAMVMIVVGFGFKISAAPFHFWTPDVYEGAPTPVTGFLSVASKAASFALLVRFFIAVFPATLVVGNADIQNFWIQIAVVSAAVTMTIGNLIALGQKNIKRLLAYSSIAQAGYTLVGVAAIQAASGEAQAAAVASIGYYMFMYVFTNLLGFAVIILFTEATGSENIADLASLSRRSPMLALMMTISLLSLAGVPPAAGFVGKFFLFRAAVESGLTWLAIYGVLNSIVALYYYLVVIKIMYVDPNQDSDKPIPYSQPYVWAMAVSAIVVILLGTVLISPVYEWAVQSAAGLFPS